MSVTSDEICCYAVVVSDVVRSVKAAFTLVSKSYITFGRGYPRPDVSLATRTCVYLAVCCAGLEMRFKNLEFLVQKHFKPQKSIFIGCVLVAQFIIHIMSFSQQKRCDIENGV